MNRYNASLIAALVLAAQPLVGYAEDAEGVARVGKGTVDAVTAPAEIPGAIAEDIEKTDPVTGTVTGTVRGTAKAAGQVVKGAAEVGVGAVEAITAPLRGE
ncbi:MAG: hypothetical protein IT495_19600 [Gammaproteobacteria bacterium]|nr:hypothetical protein [Gammaproteobacteria bacterium]